MKTYVKYSQEIADEICQKIATSTDGIKRLCKANSHWPDHGNIFRWTFEREDFRHQYAQAKAHQQDLLAEECIDISRDESRDIIDNHKGEMILNNVRVNRHKLQIDTIKWHASKLAPKKYGMQKLEVGADESLLEKIIDKL